MSQPVLHLIVGLPAVGKTTLARRLAVGHRAVRLTPDEWMIPLFGESDAGGKRDVLEGRLLWVTHEALLAGASVVVDFGCWSAPERWAIRALAEDARAAFRMHALDLPEPERRSRAAARWREAPDSTFPMTAQDQDRYVAAYEPPGPQEWSATELPCAPDGFPTWLAWAADRWPSLTDLSRP